jgi:hypothetical protein
MSFSLRFRVLINNKQHPYTSLFHMTLLLGILFLALFISAIVRGKFTYGQADYDFHEHPIQFVIVLIFILGVSALCFYRFIVEL